MNPNRIFFSIPVAGLLIFNTWMDVVHRRECQSQEKEPTRDLVLELERQLHERETYISWLRENTPPPRTVPPKAETFLLFGNRIFSRRDFEVLKELISAHDRPGSRFYDLCQHRSQKR